MKNTFMFFFAGMMVSAAFASTARRPMALMAFFDGGRADCLHNARCPNLKSMIDGTWAPGYRCAWSDAAQNIFDARTLSYPNHTSIMCGVTAVKHRVFNNDHVREKGGRHAWPTWLSRLVAANPDLSVRSFFSDRNDALISPDPRVPMTVSKSGLETCDIEATEAAVAAYRGADAPDAAMFFTEHVDITGHYYGYYPSSEEYLRSFEVSDRQLGQVLKAIRERPTFDKEDWMIVFVTDHGGKYLGHGTDDGHNHTVPLLVTGRRVTHGEMAGCPRTVDLVPTLLAHFGLPVDGVGLDGRVLGGDPAVPAALPLDKNLAFHVTFDTPYPPARRMRNATGPATWGYADRVLTGLTAPSSAGAKPVSAAYGLIDGREVPAAVTLYGSQKTIAGDRPAFTLAFWMLDEGEIYAEDPIILGNKNLYCQRNSGYTNMKEFPGFALFLRSKSDDGSRGVTLRYTMGDGLTCRTLGAFTPERGRWNFYAMSVRPEGRVTLYQGRSDGKLNWIAADCGDARWASGSFLMIGQDSTGIHVDAARLGFDEFKLWTRALTTEEIASVFGRTGGN